MSLRGNVIKHIIAPLWALKEGSPYLHHLKQLHESKTRSLKEIEDRQLCQLKKLVTHAYEHTTFYQNRMENFGLTPSDFNCLDDLVKFPVLTKNEIRDNKDKMVARNISHGKLIEKTTSGSTGVSLSLYVDEESLQWKRAVTMSYDRWTGWDIGEWVGALWGNPDYKNNWRLFLRNIMLSRNIFLDTLKIDERSMLGFYSQLKKKDVSFLFGHAHSLYLFSKFLQKSGLSDIQLKGIISTSMVLHDFERATLEKVFNCKVTNRYGCEEVSLIACECRNGSMHLNCDTLIVEFIRDGKPVLPGEPGAIVVTDLTNYGMPFIRYKVGDVGIRSGGGCTCGCSYPIVESLEGRVADYIVTPEGKYISGISLTDNFYSNNLQGIREMQIVQEEIDLIVFRIVKDESFSIKTVSDLNLLAAKFFGNRMRFAIEYVASVQLEGTGKYRFCYSKIENPFT